MQKHSGKPFPQDPNDQLTMARNAVFRSWNNPRAKEYRRIYDIPDSIGTAVNVQMMVFGNTGDRSGTGVGFTRNPATGAKEFFGEFLINAQGEDVVAGIRTPQPISELAKVMPKAYEQLRQITTRLEKHYKDIQDFEFTIQDERLYMLQTRSGKRTGYAAVVIATDLVKERLITPKEALLLVDPEALSQLLAPGFDPKEWKSIPAATRGLPASPGAACGQVVFTADDAVEVVEPGQAGDPRPARDRAGRHPRHVGVAGHPHGDRRHDVARRGRRPPDGQALDRRRRRAAIDEHGKTFTVKGQTVKEGDYVAFDGLTGEVKIAKVASQPSEILQVVAGKMKPAESDIYRPLQPAAHLGRQVPAARRARQRRPARSGRARLRVRRARHRPVPHRAHVLRRGPHSDRAAHDSRGQRSRPPRRARRAAADAARGLLRRVQGDARHAGHDPHHRSAAARVPAEARGPDGRDRHAWRRRARRATELDEKKTLLARVEQLHEFNPMLGHRGVRLGITYPEITEMQARAIMEAACQLNKEGLKVVPEIMIPLVGHVKELQRSEGDRRSRGRRGDEGAEASRSSTWSAR